MQKKSQPKIQQASYRRPAKVPTTQDEQLKVQSLGDGKFSIDGLIGNSENQVNQKPTQPLQQSQLRLMCNQKIKHQPLTMQLSRTISKLVRLCWKKSWIRKKALQRRTSTFGNAFSGLTQLELNGKIPATIAENHSHSNEHSADIPIYASH